MVLRIPPICSPCSGGLLLMVLAWWVWMSEGMIVAKGISLGVYMKDILVCGVWGVLGQGACSSMWVVCLVAEYDGNDM